MTKLVEYSYPTSINAERFGFADGCWAVETQDGVKPPRALSGHATREEAMVVATKLAIPWNPMFLKFNPDVTL